MGFVDDFKRYKYYWENFSTGTKIFLTISFIWQIISLSSISDSIFRFRGFISIIIDFYHDLLSPIIKWLNTIGFETLNQIDVDIIILFLIFFNAIQIQTSKIIHTLPTALTLLAGIIVIFLYEVTADTVKYFGMFFSIIVLFELFLNNNKRSFAMAFSFFTPILITLFILTISEAMIRPLS